jgi:UTP--glucose-1-phosphate uridylyltransferase
MKKIKAIIPAAGLGTRFMPVTRAVPKEMLPIGAKPALELIVEEARRAGADEIVIVISEEKDLIKKYFENERDIVFVYQKEQKGLGHAVLQARDAVMRDGCGQILILLGDALVFGCDASSEMISVSKQNADCSVIGFERVPMEKVSRYGIARPKKELWNDVTFILDDLVEKPSQEHAPSNLAVAGRYFLSTEIFDFLDGQQVGVGGEIQLTDAIRRMIGVKEVAGYVYPGTRQDIGNPDGYFKALEAFYGYR